VENAHILVSIVQILRQLVELGGECVHFGKVFGKVNGCVEKRGSSRASQIERDAWLSRRKRPGEASAE
jgi:hypothetical protein